MSYRRYFKIPIARAAGTPNRMSAASTRSNELVTGDVSQLQATNGTSATTLQSNVRAAVNATHLICWRCSRSPAR